MSFNPARVTRDALVKRSVWDYIHHVLFDVRGYPSERVEFMEAFQSNLFEGVIERTYVAAGNHSDDGGHPAELGTAMKRKQYVLEYWVVGRTRAEGENIAAAIEAAVESDEIIPLLDYTQADAPTIDALLADPVRFERVAVTDPAPWEEHLYHLLIPVTDEYYA